MLQALHPDVTTRSSVAHGGCIRMLQPDLPQPPATATGVSPSRRRRLSGGSRGARAVPTWIGRHGPRVGHAKRNTGAGVHPDIHTLALPNNKRLQAYERHCIHGLFQLLIIVQENHRRQ
jgi:hypothetical protein